MKKIKTILSKNDFEFQEIIKDLIINEKVNEMKKYKVHGNTSCYAHCYDVAYNCYLYCKKHNLDYVSATRAGFLHDIYLYDWHEKNSHKRPHAYTHPFTAYKNAKSITELNRLEKDMILTHMWPVTFFTVPLYRESLALTIIDKQCATAEFFHALKVKIKKPKLQTT